MGQKPQFYIVYMIVAAITFACFLMNGPMRGGLPLDNTLQERAVFIAEHRFVWTMSWVVWMFSAIGLFCFCSILASELKRHLLRTIGLALVGMGIAPDLIAEVLYAFVMPEVIQRGLNIHTVEVLEIIAMHLTGFLGNGLYNLGGFLLTLLAYKQGVLKVWVFAWGVLAWILGLLLSLSVGVGSIQAAELFTAASMVLSTLWMLVFAHTVLKW